MNDDHRIARRHLLFGMGGAAAALGIGATGARSASAESSQSPGAHRSLELADIQGNVLAGFHQHQQAMVLVAFPTPAAGQAWLRAVAPTVVSAATVEAARAAFQRGDAVAPATWVNVALSHRGLQALGRDRGELDRFPRAFRAGMAGRARRIGDTGANAPGNWPAPYRRRIDAIAIVAADSVADLDAAVARQRTLAAGAGVTVVHVEQGAARVDEPGHEHFGFRDGISQPGLRGFTTPDPTDPDQGQPGQDLLWPGEFVLGYPRQAGVGGGDAPGPIARSGPDWTDNGSYLVFRRLTQDVAGFRAFVAGVAAAQGTSEDLIGAKLVGRYKSGAPLTVTGEEATDPAVADPSLLDTERVNDFEFEDDFDGERVPLAAHIRKAYPRDQPTDDGGEEDTQTHRLLRRGIPFGTSLVGGADPTPRFPADRGLLFLAYQWSIERQFEHVQQRWFNDPDFPDDGAGQDPVVAQSPATGSFSLPGGRPDHVALMARFVTTTGGEYFFQPSIAALAMLSRPAPSAVAQPDRPPRSERPAPPRPGGGRPAGGAPGSGRPGRAPSPPRGSG